MYRGCAREEWNNAIKAEEKGDGEKTARKGKKATWQRTGIS